ncbi:MAG: hypothetical protein AAF823_01465 [Planctomycetota bacterium]
MGRDAAYTLAGLCGAACHGEALAIDRCVLGDTIDRGFDFLLDRQAPDGRLDLHGVYSANEAGFPLPALAVAYRHLEHRDAVLFGRIADRMQAFMVRAADAVVAGDAYSANHRWAAAAGPLAAVHRLFPADRYIEKVHDYLADPIDCEADGFWFEERSPNYNMVANHGLLVLADELDRPDLVELVVQSCKLVLRFLQPNGEADSSFSFRQDRGQPDCPAAAYRVARRAAIASGDGQLTSLADQVRDARNNATLMPMTLEWLEHPGDMPEPETIETRFDAYWPDRQIARRREGVTALTLAADPGEHFFDTVLDSWGGVKRSEDWFHLHHGGIVLQSVRLELSRLGSVRPVALERLSSTRYRLADHADGWGHIAHFRPGSPAVRMPHRYGGQIEVNIDPACIDLAMDFESPDVIQSSLRFFVRAGVEVEGIGRLQAG